MRHFYILAFPDEEEREEDNVAQVSVTSFEFSLSDSHYNEDSGMYSCIFSGSFIIIEIFLYEQNLNGDRSEYQENRGMVIILRCKTVIWSFS